MRIRLCSVLLCLLLASPAAMAQDTVIPLKVAFGQIVKDRDLRVFAMPAKVDETETQLVWGCNAFTEITQSLASKCGLEIKSDRETEAFLDGTGQPLYVGRTRADITVGGRRMTVGNIKVRRDSQFTKGIDGEIGYEIVAMFQWELNPDAQKPTLTLRPTGAKPPGGVVANLPIKDEGDNLWVTVKARNVDVAVALAPQVSDIQAAPDLQKAWDIASGQEEKHKGLLGTQRIRQLTGPKDYVEFTPQIREGNLVVVLVGDKDHPEATPGARSGLGASLLNRFVYRVDVRAGEFVIVKRLGPPTGKVAPPTRK
jgi:hypothetical protein